MGLPRMFGNCITVGRLQTSWFLSGSIHWQGRRNKNKALKKKSGRLFILEKYLALFLLNMDGGLRYSHGSETFKSLNVHKAKEFFLRLP